MHIIENAFNVLGKPGFLRDQGIMTLEVVQNFYKLIREKPTHATVKVSRLLDFCTAVGHCKLKTLPIITLMMESSGDTLQHAVNLERYLRTKDYLFLTVVDPLQQNKKIIGQTKKLYKS